VTRLLILTILLTFLSKCEAQQKSDFVESYAKAALVEGAFIKVNKRLELKEVVQLVSDISEPENVNLRSRNADDSKNENRLTFVQTRKKWTISVVNRKNVREEIQKQQDRYYKLKQEIAQLSAYSPPRMRSLSVGSVGVLEDENGKSLRLKVGQVLGSRIMVENGDSDFLLEGFDVSSLADGDNFVLTDVCICEKNETLTTVIGAAKTVPVLRVAGDKELADAIQYCKDHPIEAKRQTRLWSDSSGSFSVEGELLFNRKGKATIRKLDGKEIEVPLIKLSADDRKFIKDNGDPW
jgi:hypothetical protein